MKRLIAIACAFAFIPLAWGQFYKWVDKDGKVHYSDTPPSTQDAKQLNVQTGGGSPPPPPAAQKDKEAEKGRLDVKIEAEKARAQKAADESCKAS